MFVVSEAFSEPAPVSVPAGLSFGTPCAFKGCAGYFHPAGGSVGVVLCPPWGFEDLVLRKSWRLLAEAIAAAGYPCLRFDYPGTGDSLGTATSIESVATWVESIHAAADLLRLNSGVRRFVFLGQSLGALLAVEAARTRTDVAALHLVAPVTRGKAYLREMAATAAMIADRVGITLELATDEALSVVGFGLSHAMVDDLKRLNATRIDALRVDHATIFDSPCSKAGADMLESLRRIGVAAAMEETAPHQIMVSDATEIQPLPVAPERIVAALQRLAPGSPATAPSRMPAALVAETFYEQPIRFGSDGGLFGVLAQPFAERRGGTAVVLLNRGLNPHIGWRRSTVDHARALADAGITSLRIDVAGLGESRDEPDRPARLVYSLQQLSDIHAAVDVLAARGHTRIALAGVCSGAFLALNAAHADPRVTDLVVFNPQRFVWRPDESMEDFMRFGLRSVDDYVGDLKRGGFFRKLVRSRRRILPALTFLARKQIRRALRTIMPHLPPMLVRSPMAVRVKAMFATFAERGTRVSMVFTACDPSIEELQTYFGRRHRIAGNVSVEILENVDHNITSPSGSATMLACLLLALRGAAEAPMPRAADLARERLAV